MVEWLDLPEELVEVTLSKLFDRDRHNFRLVCRSWNAIAETSPYHQNSPSLIYYDRVKRLWGFYQYNSFFFRRFPRFGNAEIACSKYGWLLMCRDDKSLFFFDPFNETSLELDLEINESYTSLHFFNPPTSPECFIVGIDVSYNDGAKIDVLRHGKNEWVSHTFGGEVETSDGEDDGEDEGEVETSDGEDETFITSMAAPVLHDGLLYFVAMNGDVATLDVNTIKDEDEDKDDDEDTWVVYRKCLQFRKLRTKIRRHYLLKIKGEEAVYAVFLIHDTLLVNVFRLSADMQWELVEDLGDYMLYLSHPCSFGDKANPKSMGNTICFPAFDDDSLCFYSLKTRKYHSVEGHNSYKNSSNLTSFDYGAAWIRPIHTPQVSLTDFKWYDISEDDIDTEECDPEEYDSKDDTEESDLEEYDSESDDDSDAVVNST